MIDKCKKMIPVLCLLGVVAPVLAESNPFTMDKMLADKDVIPAVNACLNNHQQGQQRGQAFVQSIMPMNHGMVNIVTGDTDGRRLDCVAELRTGTLKEQTPLVDAAGPLFISAANRTQAPAGECFTTKPVKTGKKTQGWLLTQNGKCGGYSWQGIESK